MSVFIPCVLEKCRNDHKIMRALADDFKGAVKKSIPDNLRKGYSFSNAVLTQAITLVGIVMI